MLYSSIRFTVRMVHDDNPTDSVRGGNEEKKRYSEGEEEDGYAEVSEVMQDESQTIKIKDFLNWRRPSAYRRRDGSESQRLCAAAKEVFCVGPRENPQLNRRIWKSINEIARILGPEESVSISEKSISVEFFTNMNIILE